MEVEVGMRALTVTVVEAWAGAELESVTVAVQLVEAPAAKAGGLQLTVVTVGCLVTVTAAAVALEELSWVASPSYVATRLGGPTAELQSQTKHVCRFPVAKNEQLAKAVVEAS